VSPKWLEPRFEDRPTAHDLRRTLATRLAAVGIAAEDVKACLNHARGDVTGRLVIQAERFGRNPTSSTDEDVFRRLRERLGLAGSQSQLTKGLSTSS
jgi:integrase